MKAPFYMFSIPNLPPDVYAWFRLAKKDLDLTDRQLVLLAIQVLKEEGHKDTQRIRELASQIRKEHPSRARKDTDA